MTTYQVPRGCKSFSATPSKKRSAPATTVDGGMSEAYVASQIATYMNYRAEVETDYGRIDILTESTVVECKNSTGRWKEALGQIIAYSLAYPGKQKEVWFFCKRVERIEKIFESLGIVCCWFPQGGLVWKCILPPKPKP